MAAAQVPKRRTPAHATAHGRRPALAVTLASAFALALALAPQPAQALCTSDGVPAPMAVLERFINADCAHCWSALTTPRPAARTLALDWIVPGRRGASAPLAAAASRDALHRLAALALATPLHTAQRTSVRQPGPQRLRVALGPAINDHVGTSIAFTPARPGQGRAWLLLVEALPAGTEGSPVPRNLVRNAFAFAWDTRAAAAGAAADPAVRQLRSMQVAEGAQPQRLGVVALVEDSQGRLSAAVASRCAQDGRPPR